MARFGNIETVGGGKLIFVPSSGGAASTIATTLPVGGLIFDENTEYRIDGGAMTIKVADIPNATETLTQTIIWEADGINKPILDLRNKRISPTINEFETRSGNYIVFSEHKNLLVSITSFEGQITGVIAHSNTVSITVPIGANYQQIFDDAPSGALFTFEVGNHAITSFDTHRSGIYISKSAYVHIPQGCEIRFADNLNNWVQELEIITAVYTEFNGVNDATFSFTGTIDRRINKRLKITGTGNPDSYALTTVYDDETPGIPTGTTPLTAGLIDLGDNIFVEFASLTGHTLNDEWWICTSGEEMYLFRAGYGFQEEYIEDVHIFGQGAIHCNKTNNREANHLVADISAGFLAHGRTRNTSFTGVEIIDSDRPVMAYGAHSGTYGNYGATFGGEEFNGENLVVQHSKSLSTQRGHLIGHPAHRGYFRNYCIEYCDIETEIGDACIEPNFRTSNYTLRYNRVNPGKAGSDSAIICWRPSRDAKIYGNRAVGNVANIVNVVKTITPAGWELATGIKEWDNSVDGNYSVENINVDETFPIGWAKKVRVEINHNFVVGSHNQITIPIQNPEVITPIRTVDPSGISVRVTSDEQGLNRLAMDRVITAGSVMFQINVLVKNLSDVADNYIYIWYDKADAIDVPASSPYGAHNAFLPSKIFYNDGHLAQINGGGTVTGALFGNGGLQLNGTDQFLDLNRLLPRELLNSGLKGITVLCNVNFNTIQGSGIFSYRNSVNDLLQLFLTGAGNIIANARSSGTAVIQLDSGAASTGTPYQLALILDLENNLLKLRRNGVEQEISADLQGTLSSAQVSFGSVIQDGLRTSFVHGVFDEMYVYNEPLTSDAIETYENALSNQNEMIRLK